MIKIKRKKEKPDEIIHEYRKYHYTIYLRLIEFNCQIIWQMFNIHGIYIKFKQLINCGGIVLNKQRDMQRELEWTNNRGYFVKRSSVRYSCDRYKEWFFNDNDNCIMARQYREFIAIPISQLLLK